MTIRRSVEISINPGIAAMLIALPVFQVRKRVALHFVSTSKNFDHRSNNNRQ
jgi:hypothetical protein